MTPEEAAEKIKTICDEMSKATLQFNPAIRALDDEALRGELLQAVFQLTTDLEKVKKLLRGKGRRDTQAL